MKLSVWTYEGPPHVGAMRVATAMKGLHYVLHAPQGDTYADLLFTMIERRNHRPPVTYTTFESRDLGKDTAQLFQDAAMDAVERFNPEAIIVGARRRLSSRLCCSSRRLRRSAWHSSICVCSCASRRSLSQGLAM